ncbi:acid ceramidase-like protein [Acanthamoeba polyphaga mimivirus]|uniref:Acid ceramidase-like protein n=1 Tax=Acanthamoeba polyphaga mimivirus Kroon TaxID=3069720 RepID=A0A0G2Y3J8_9VIRU|nr:acid ceramidase-like protein [Acanthamoeba polyphaga mimivirus]AKI80368.1 acid ceramidase-like protein [Acanthamoeba polyphaga mimivirus Kroon]
MKEIVYYDFDLDLNAEVRWVKIFDAFKDKITDLKSHLVNLLKPHDSSLKIVSMLSGFINPENILHYGEIKYITDRLGMKMYEIIILQLVYEITAACTSAVIDVGDNKLFLRTLDWPLEFLKDFTIGLNIIRGNKKIGQTITWIGYLGFLTAWNHKHNYTIAINYRTSTESNQSKLAKIIKNIQRTITLKWPVGYMVRYLIENEKPIEKVIAFTTEVQLISPCYITVYISDGQSFVVTRDCHRTVDIRTDNLIQTNCDFGKNKPNILYSVERRDYVESVIASITTDTCPDKLIKTLLKFPVVNEDTIFWVCQFEGKTYSKII